MATMTKKQPDIETVTVSGEIYAIRYRNADNWAVFSMAGVLHGFSGTLADICEVGTHVTCTGEMITSKYGRQLKCSAIVPATPDVSTADGVARMLCRLPGIGQAKASMAVRVHGPEQAWRLALENPAAIGVRPESVDAAQTIARSMLESYEMTVYLLGIGLTDYQAARIYRRYRGKAKMVVSENPYQLIEDIDGFGFRTVDKIALKAGVSVGAAARVNACVLFVLDDSATNEGHVWHDGWRLADIVLDVLTDSAMKAEMPLVEMPGKDAIRAAVHFLAAEGRLVLEKGKVFSKSALDAEKKILEFATIGA